MSATRQQTIIHAGWLIDGLGGPPRPDMLITIKDNRILSIDPLPKAAPLPKGVVGFAHATILPALMDAHVHLAMSGTANASRRNAQLNATRREVLNCIAGHLEKYRLWGVAAVRDAGDRHGTVLQAKQTGTHPHVAATCCAWHCSGRYGGMIGQPLTSKAIGSGDLARALTGADHIKLIQSGINSLDQLGRETPPQFSADQLRAIAQTAQQISLPMMVHANGKIPVSIAIAAGCRSVEHGYFMGTENLKRMADQQIFWVPTAIPMAALTKEDIVTKDQAAVAQKSLDHQLAQIDTARQLGVPIALGTDAGAIGVHHGVSVAQEIGLYMDAGMPVGEAVHCATLNNARLMGLEKQGALRPGWDADMIAVKGEPTNLPLSLNRSGCLRFKGKGAGDS